MNMLSSLKALLFSSTAVPAAGGEGGLPAPATDGGSLFAAMLADTMGKGEEGAEPAQTATAGSSPVSPSIAGPVETMPIMSVPTLEKGIAPRIKPKVVDGAESVKTGKFLPPDAGYLPVAEDAPDDVAEQAGHEDQEQPQTAQPSWLAVPGPIPSTPVPSTVKDAERAATEVTLPAAVGDKPSSAATVENDSIISVPAAAPLPSPENGRTEAGAKTGSTSPPVASGEAPPMTEAAHTPPVADAASAPVAKGDHDPQSTPVRRRVGWIDKEQRVAEKATREPETDVVSEGKTGDVAAPVLNGKPVKSEALALLQIVRDQVSAKQSGASVKVGEAVSAAASSKEKPRSHQPSVEMPSNGAPLVDATASPPQVAAMASTPQSPLQSTPVMAAPVADISATLGAEVVDMGVSGQWIDGLARDIAGLSANGAEGRFQIHADKLGTVQVDIRQHADGAAVNLTVASEGAEQALRQDSDRLRLDAGLSAVRIADVKIERVSPVAEAARPDGPGQQTSQQQSHQHQSTQTSAWHHGNQDMSQSQGQGRWQARENSGFTSKPGNDPAVLNHADGRETSGNAVRARYA